MVLVLLIVDFTTAGPVMGKVSNFSPKAFVQGVKGNEEEEETTELTEGSFSRVEEHQETL